MRIVVVEDEDVVAQRLMRLVQETLGGRVEFLHRECSLPGALEYVRTHPIDLLFLDLNLRGRNGFQLLHEAAAESFQTIVVSAQHDAALQAFEYGVTDFVAKPYDSNRLRTAIARATERDEDLRNRLKYLAVRLGNKIVPVAIESIAYIKGADDYSEIHRDNGTTCLHAKTLAALENILPSRYQRTHRSYIVDLSKVKNYRTDSNRQHWLELASGEELPVSRTRFKQLRSRMP